MALPLILAGPILRRVEPNLVAVWVALQEAASVALALWENQIEASSAKDSNIWFRSPEPAKTIRLGDTLHLAVVTLRLPEGKTLIPERLYSYDVEITTQGQTTRQNLASLQLLQHDPPNANPDGDTARHLALGYRPGLLPCVVLPPKELTDLRLVHGSCRNIDTSFPDGLAWLDDLLSRDDAYTSAVKRPHQLFLTGDQIYADEVPRPMLHMLNGTAQQLFGTNVEQLPYRDRSTPPKVLTAPANLTQFPVGRRKNILLNEGGMTTTAGRSHLLSFGEFCAMYLYAWSNVCWEQQLETPPARTALPPDNAEEAITSPGLKDLITLDLTGQPGETAEDQEYTEESYQADLARLVEFRRTLPKVRRALANVPSYMIFDDHEITDDWYLTQTWRDRVLGSPLGSAVIRNGMLAYALFQGWGNDPVKFEPRPGLTEKQPHEELLDAAARLFPAGATSAPDITTPGNAAGTIDTLLGLQLRNQQAIDGSYAETNPKLKWFYSVPGTKHQVLVLDCRTRRSFASRVSPPGNIGKDALKEQIPEVPDPAGKEVWFVVSSLPVLGPPIFDELFAPTLVRTFDAIDALGKGELQKNRGTKRAPGTNPDAVEAWCFEPPLFEALLKRLKPYAPVVLLSGDVHYSASNSMTYWSKGASEPVRFVQFISSGLKNVMPDKIVTADRSLAFTQRMIRARIGAERLGWEKNSPDKMHIPSGSDISPRLRGLLRQSPLLVPTIGWRGATSEAPEWAWRVCPVRDVREENDRPKMARPVSLFPDDTDKKDADITTGNLDGYHRTAQRHFRELDRLNNCRQILFASNIGVVRFESRVETVPREPGSAETDGATATVMYAIHDLYTVKRDPEELVAPVKPEVFTRHEIALRDLWQKQPALPKPPQP